VNVFGVISRSSFILYMLTRKRSDSRLVSVGSSGGAYKEYTSVAKPGRP